MKHRIANLDGNPMQRICLSFCWVFLFSLFLSSPLSSVFAAGNDSPSTVGLKDVDNDGLADAVIDTKSLKVIVSSKTGNISLYYLKGINFEENLYPPVLLDFGYKFASDTLSPFNVSFAFPFGEESKTFANPSFTIVHDDTVKDRLVVAATANLPPTDISLIKRFTFRNQGYVFDQEIILTNLAEKEIIMGNAQLGSPGVSLRYGPGLFLDPFNPSTFMTLSPNSQEKYETLESFLKGAAAGEHTGIGLKTTYFCALIESKVPVKLFAKGFEVVSAEPNRKAFPGEVVGLDLPPFSLKSKESKSFSFNFYYGPKLLDELLAIHRDQVTDYGFLSTMLLRLLQFFYALAPNYGVAIMLLTILVRIALYPLTLSQTKSMAKMQKIQPLVQDIKDRYKDDPQKFNEEVLKLYQKHEVNPLGGCLPLLLQLPILIALYNTINICVELRKTPFLWIGDLSKADPYLLLPIAITALMYLQQGKMTDPQQQQMMAFMPMFMFVITWSLPSGLLIYWFVSSVIGVLQQIQANRLMVALKEE